MVLCRRKSRSPDKNTPFNTPIKSLAFRITVVPNSLEGYVPYQQTTKSPIAMHHSCLPAALAALAAIVPETFATAPDGGLLGVSQLRLSSSTHRLTQKRSAEPLYLREWDKTCSSHPHPAAATGLVSTRTIPLTFGKSSPLASSSPDLPMTFLKLSRLSRTFPRVMLRSVVVAIPSGLTTTSPMVSP